MGRETRLHAIARHEEHKAASQDALPFYRSRPHEKIYAAERLGRTCMSASCSGDYLFPCPTVPPRSSRRSWRLVRRSLRRSLRLSRRSSRRSLRLSRRSWRRSIPGVWASASGAVSTAAGIPMPNAAPSPKSKRLFDARPLLLEFFHAWPTSLGFFHWWRATKSIGRAGADREVSARRPNRQA